MLVNAFFLSQFSYCPLLWLCHSRNKKEKINGLLERYLQFIYNGKQSPFHEPLERDGSVSIHKQNLGFLAIDMLEITKGIALTLVRENVYFDKENNTNCVIVQILQSELLTLSVIGQKVLATQHSRFGKRYSQTYNKLNHCPNLILKLESGTLKIVNNSLRDTLAKYWFYLNLTHDKQNFFHMFGKEKFSSFVIANTLLICFFIYYINWFI